MDTEFPKFQSGDSQPRQYIPYIQYPTQTFQDYLNLPPPPTYVQNFSIANEAGNFHVHLQTTSLFMSSNESRKRKGTVVDESGNIHISYGDQFLPHSTTHKALQNIDLNIGVDRYELIDEVVDGADKTHGTNKKKDRTQWSVDEEIILAESSCTISNDSVVGIDQTNTTFWERITTYYNDHRPNKTPPRLWKRAKTHFYQFYAVVNEFSAIYNNFYNNPGSGWNDEIILAKTHEQFRHNNKAKRNKVFKYEHVWKVFKNSEKSVPQQPDHHASKKTRKLDSAECALGSSSSPSPNPDTTFDLDDCVVRPRPIGQKAAKRKNMLDIQSKKLKLMDVELRQKDYDILLKDTIGMKNAQQLLHDNICEQIKKDHGLM